MNGYDASMADVIRDTIHNAQDLVRGEIALAKAELRGEVSRVSRGAAALAAAGVAAVLAVTFLLAALAWGIAAASGWPTWTGLAIVGAVVLVAAALLAMMGKKSFNGERHMPLTTDTMKENMRWTRAQRP